VFTSGATEALNQAFLYLQQAKAQGRNHVIILETEHAAVRDTAFHYGAMGYDIDVMPVQPNGLVNLDQLKEKIADQTAMVAAMLVNNEIGVIQPVEDIAEMAHRVGAVMLCDAVQGYGRIPIPDNVDMVAVSAHKIYGPKGVGALWSKSSFALPPLIYGGGQEQGLRSGTLSPALCAGLGMAAQLCKQRWDADRTGIETLSGLARQLFADWKINGSTTDRYSGNLNIWQDGLDVARLMSDVRSVMFSAGSACASGSGRPSHVLNALGLSPAGIKSSIRLGFGRYTQENELVEAAQLINEAAAAQKQ